jgi:hypothetical protein
MFLKRFLALLLLGATLIRCFFTFVAIKFVEL